MARNDIVYHNTQVFYKAKAEIGKYIFRQGGEVWRMLVAMGDYFLEHAWKEHGTPMNGGDGWSGFTGNTQTSYAYGIYRDGVIADICFIGDVKAPPVHVKVRKGESLYLEHPYEGLARGWPSGMAETVEDFGQETSARFLASYKPSASYGLSLVVCTGTEYSEWIEENMGNVLTLTGRKDNVSDIYKKAMSEFKAIDVSWR